MNDQPQFCGYCHRSQAACERIPCALANMRKRFGRDPYLEPRKPWLETYDAYDDRSDLSPFTRTDDLGHGRGR